MTLLPLSAQTGPLRATLAPHWGALLALALFLIVGLAVLDDYGVTTDEPVQRRTVQASLRYVAGGDLPVFLSSLTYSEDRFYGMAFEAAIILVERAFGLEEGRGVWTLRHLLIHLFFLTGGLFAYLLARRLSGNSAVGLFAMALFLLHPRLYAHSFFNSKDIPFLALFMVTLFLAHRAFKRDTVSAFILAGAAAGALVNLRIFGVILLAAIPALRALDFLAAAEWRRRKRVLITTGAFALACGLTHYALLPYLWADPVGRAVEWWATLSDHPHKPYELFRGVLGRSADFPEYLPVWFSMTSPPFALLLGLVGAAALFFAAAKRPLAAIRNTRLRFAALLFSCFALPILAVVLLDANIFSAWRHLHFVWAPFSLLAAFGLQRLASALRLRRLRTATYGAAGAGLAAAIASMSLIHPNQHVFFNFFVDRVTPEQLRTQYVMDYWGHPTRQALEWILERGHSSPVAANLSGDDSIAVNLSLLPDASQEKFAWAPSLDSLTIKHGHGNRPDLVAHRVQIYGNTVMTVERKDDLRAIYEATQGREPILDAAFDVHRLDDGLAVAMEPCAPSFLTETALMLRTFPVDRDDLPGYLRGKGFEPWRIALATQGAFFDGKCVASFPIPDYPIARFEFIWEPEPLNDNPARESMRRAEAEGSILARSAYDIYLSDGELVYIQEQCDPLETESVFYLDAFPIRASDLPQGRRGRGYERFHFRFHQRGALLEDGTCVALFPLSDYPVAAVRTGQRAEGEGDLWSAAFSMNPEPYAAAYSAVEGSEPVARGSFDLYLIDGDLVYVKEPCEQADTEARFFLHVVPERVSDLPEARRGAGFDNLDFRFFLNGAQFDDQCVARVALPDYPIASVRTGQFVGAEGEIWSVEFAPSPDGGRGQPRSGARGSPQRRAEASASIMALIRRNDGILTCL